MRTRTKGIQLDDDGERTIDKQYRGERVFERLGKVSQDDAEAWLRQRQAEIDTQRQDQLRQGNEQLFRAAAGKYLIECRDDGDVRSLETICGHVLLLNHWIGDVPLHELCNDSLARFKADRLAGRTHEGGDCRPVKHSTVNRSLEVVSTVLNRASRVWRHKGKPWLASSPLIEMLDEEKTKRRPYPITWSQQADLMPKLEPHLQRMVLFALNTGARDENVCGLRWEWEIPVAEAGRSVFVIPAAEFKTKRDHVLILNDVAWSIVQEQRGKHADFVFVYRRERVVNLRTPPAMKYRRVGTMNNTGFQRARVAAGIPKMRVQDTRHTFAQRLRDAGVNDEDRALLLGHVIEGMPQHYATATIARLVEMANKVQETRDRMTLLRVVNG